MDNLENWNKLKTPPQWAIKTISGGRLSGKSDINPQWRYKAMTEVYGTCGIGWKFDVVREWEVPGTDGQIMVFVKVAVRIATEHGWSESVTAIGGDFLIEKESRGMHCNDEAYKMATTDALGTCLKYFGVASDVYEGGNHDTKSTRKEPAAKEPSNALNVAQRKLLADECASRGINPSDVKEWLKTSTGSDKVTQDNFQIVLDTIRNSNFKGDANVK
jgi:hypothetical protein